MLEVTLFFICFIGVIALVIFLEHVALIRHDVKSLEQGINKLACEISLLKSYFEKEKANDKNSSF